jgi:DNA-binding NtrC family response regulator
MSDGAAALLGSSAVINAVRASIRHAARSEGTVLLIGEPGTGKDLAAGTIHSLSSRSSAKHEVTYEHLNVSITHGALASLAARHWFGNVRDLENFLQVRLATAPPGELILDETAVRSGVAPI